MNNRREDALIQLAFGELSEAEAKALRASMSESERQEADLMATLRQDLKAMPVAPHQLSTERLRDAILNEGLHPKPQATPWWRFAWAPVAVLALAFVGTRMMADPMPSEPMVAINEGAIMSTPSPELDVQPSRNPMTFSAPGQPEVAASTATAAAPAARSSKRNARSASRSSETRMLAMASAPEAPSGPAAQVANAVISNAAPAQADSAVDSAALRESREEPKPGIVLIDSERDSATGANRAIEVSSASNVVIGG